MKIHSIKVSAFYRKEDADLGEKTLSGLLPKESEIKKTVLEGEMDGDVFTKPLVILSAGLTKKKEIKDFMGKILSRLSESDKKRVRENTNAWMDDDCNLYLRLDKEKAASGDVMLTVYDPIHIRIKVEAYPKKKENAIKNLDEILGQIF